MSWNVTLQKLLTHVVHWLTRPRHRSRILLVAATTVMVAIVGGGWSFGVTGSAGALHFRGYFSTGNELPLWVVYLACAIAVMLFFAGAVMLIHDFVADVRRTRRCAVIALELRGLVDTSDRPLLQSVPRRLSGQPLDAQIDIRPEMGAGAVELAFNKLSGIPDVVRRLRGTREKRDVQLLVAGVLQVPFLFYAGVLLDDEGAVTAMDWDRKAGRWKELDSPDDGERFLSDGLDRLAPNTGKVVLAVSASYRTDTQAIAATFGTTPIVSLALPMPLPDSLWSEAKQVALAAQFLEALAELGNRGVRGIALILAAPSSLVLRLGRAYDRRNLPEIACYQYQRDVNPPYPWSVVIGPTDARLVEAPKGSVRVEVNAVPGI
ncbi:SAVED domain-containing protein [Frateuria sp. MAH-13]|uniref:SAVED domain-containing protein n=1 Tax=Frateuria flava TaxID=2821489 RepID=A0ABS4DKD4_9GAMM|nr:SAVED domain-containing protein [Frateuria flava]MBP1473513.1 SAVED domain-containing protein [Frateuria flava]